VKKSTSERERERMVGEREMCVLIVFVCVTCWGVPERASVRESHHPGVGARATQQQILRVFSYLQKICSWEITHRAAAWRKRRQPEGSQRARIGTTILDSDFPCAGPLHVAGFGTAARTVQTK